MNTKEWTILGAVVGVGGLILYIRNKNAASAAAQSPDNSALQDYELMSMLSALGNGYATQQSDSTQPVGATDETGNLVNDILNGGTNGSNSDSGTGSSSTTTTGTGRTTSSGGNPVAVGPEPVPPELGAPTNSSNNPPIQRFGGLSSVGARLNLLPQ